MGVFKGELLKPCSMGVPELMSHHKAPSAPAADTRASPAQRLPPCALGPHLLDPIPCLPPIGSETLDWNFCLSGPQFPQLENGHVGRIGSS